MAAAVLMLVLATPTTVAARNAQLIAFTSDEGGALDIWTMQADRSHRSNLINDDAEDLFPAWSPDGTKIAFTHRTGTSRFIMRANGSGVRQLTDTALNELVDDTSADSDKILFEVAELLEPGFGQSDLAVVDLDDRAITYLTSTQDINEFDGAWAPDL